MYRWNGGSKTAIGKRLSRKITKRDSVKKIKEPEVILPIPIPKKICHMPIDVLTGAVVESKNNRRVKESKGTTPPKKIKIFPVDSQSVDQDPSNCQKQQDLLSESDDFINSELEGFIKIDSLPLSPKQNCRTINTQTIYNQKPK